MRRSRGKAKRIRKRQTPRPHLVSREGNPPDAQIDTSDIPPLGEEFFQKAVRNPFYRPAE